MSSMTFKTMMDLRQEINEINKLIDQTAMVEDMTNQINEFDYQGLDIQVIANTIYAKGAAAGLDKNAIKSDISSVILLFLCRGNNVDKMLTRTSEAGSQKIQKLKNTYGLMNNVGQGGNTVITLSRVA